MGTLYNALPISEKRIVDACIELWKRPDVLAQNRVILAKDIEEICEVISMRDRIFLANKILYIELMYRDMEIRAKNHGADSVRPGMPMAPELKDVYDAKNALRFYRREAMQLLTERTKDPFRREFITVGINNYQMNAIKAINEVENNRARRGHTAEFRALPTAESMMAPRQSGTVVAFRAR